MLAEHCAQDALFGPTSPRGPGPITPHGPNSPLCGSESAKVGAPTVTRVLALEAPREARCLSLIHI
eukprot:2034531-Alexandrium_andersonii.AAC.1